MQRLILGYACESGSYVSRRNLLGAALDKHYFCGGTALGEEGAHAVKVGGGVGEEELVALAEGVDAGAGVAVLRTFAVAGREEGTLQAAFG